MNICSYCHKIIFKTAIRQYNYRHARHEYFHASCLPQLCKLAKLDYIREYNK